MKQLFVPLFIFFAILVEGFGTPVSSTSLKTKELDLSSRASALLYPIETYTIDSISLLNDSAFTLKLDQLEPIKAYWIKVELYSEDSFPTEWVCSFGEWWFNNCLFYQKNSNGLWEEQLSGIFVPLSRKQVKVGVGCHYYLRMLPGKNTYYLNILPQKKTFSTQGLIQLQHVSLWNQQIHIRNIVQWSYFSILFFLVLFTIIFFIFLRDVIYLYSAIYFIMLSVLSFSRLGLAQEIFFPEHPKLVPFLWNLSGLGAMFYLLFMRSFLNTSKLVPKWDKGIDYSNYAIIAFVLIGIVNMLINVDNFILQEVPISIAYSFIIAYIFLLQIKLIQTQSRLAYLFVLSSASIIIGAFVAQFTSVFHGITEGWYLLQFGIIMEAFLFSFSLAYRVVLNIRESNQTQMRLIKELKKNESFQRDINVKLERMVLMRTNEIEKKNKELNKRNKENELLLGEIHHRVKNNLQVLSSIFSLQRREVKDEESKQIINEARNRIKSMALIHTRLYQNEEFEHTEMRGYVTHLISELATSYGIELEKIPQKIEIERIKLSIDQAIPLGLIINELLSNSFKYAFSNIQKAFLNISLVDKKGDLIFIIKDGSIINKEEIFKNTSFGLKLVESLTRQVGGSLDISQNKGLQFKITIKQFKKKEPRIDED